MNRLILLFCLLSLSLTGYASEQVYFKIAVNENDYSTFLTDSISTRKKTLQYLATKMRQPFFRPEHVNRDFYDVKVSSGIMYFGKEVTQYDVIPRFNDRFRHILMVDKQTDLIIRKEVYDPNGKLVFSFSSLERDIPEKVPSAEEISVAEPVPAFKGYYLLEKKILRDQTEHFRFSDGLNSFSVFRKKTDSEPTEEKRIIYGNYIYRSVLDDEQFIVVGTIPFDEMKLLVENISKLEEKE